jgi:hypothetical protein
VGRSTRRRHEALQKCVPLMVGIDKEQRRMGLHLQAVVSPYVYVKFLIVHIGAYFVRREAGQDRAKCKLRACIRFRCNPQGI